AREPRASWGSASARSATSSRSAEQGVTCREDGPAPTHAPGGNPGRVSLGLCGEDRRGIRPARNAASRHVVPVEPAARPLLARSRRRRFTRATHAASARCAHTCAGAHPWHRACSEHSGTPPQATPTARRFPKSPDRGVGSPTEVPMRHDPGNAYEAGAKTAVTNRELEATALFKAARKLEACLPRWGDPGHGALLDEALRYNLRLWTL